VGETVNGGFRRRREFDADSRHGCPCAVALNHVHRALVEAHGSRHEGVREVQCDVHEQAEGQAVVARLVWKSEMAHSSGYWELANPKAGRRARRPPEECAVGEHIRTGARPHDGRPGSLGELIHAAVRHAIEVAVDGELTTALGAPRYARCGSRCGYRNGTKPRMLTGPTGPLALTVPRATVFTPTGSREWASTLLPRYQRRLREVNEAVVAPIWPAATRAGFAAPSARCSRRPRSRRARSRESWGRSRPSSRPGAHGRWPRSTSWGCISMPWLCGCAVQGRS
jgi:Transposase, Mutator family